MQIYVKRVSDEEKRERDYMLIQMAQKESLCRQLKESVQERTVVVSKLERKLKLMAENNKIKNLKDPIEYYNELS